MVNNTLYDFVQDFLLGNFRKSGSEIKRNEPSEIKLDDGEWKGKYIMTY